MHKLLVRTILASGFVMGATFMAVPAVANTIGLDFTAAPTTVVENYSDGTFGYEFSLSTPQTVNALGFWNLTGHAYDADTAVALWDANTQTQLGIVHVASDPVTVTPSGGPAGSGEWLFMPVNILLAPGTYIVGATQKAFTDPPVAFDPSFSTNLLVFIAGVSNQDSNAPGVPAYPINFQPSYSWFGANIQFADASAVPLPAAFPFFASSLGVMGLLGWRGKRKKAAAMVAA